MALKRATLGHYFDSGRISKQLRRKGLKPTRHLNAQPTEHTTNGAPHRRASQSAGVA